MSRVRKILGWVLLAYVVYAIVKSPTQAADVVKTTCFLIDIDDFAAFNAVYGRFMSDPPPARSTFAVAALPKGARVEIEAIAVRQKA